MRRTDRGDAALAVCRQQFLKAAYRHAPAPLFALSAVENDAIILPITGKKNGGIFLNKRFDVTIAGEINLDLVLDGIPEAMPVERELLASACRVTLGSSAAILAHNLRALGMRVGFASLAAGTCSAPRRSNYLRRARRGPLAEVRTSESGTGSGVTVVVNHGAARHILSYLGTTAEIAP